jgi:hypothetical protein
MTVLFMGSFGDMGSKGRCSIAPVLRINDRIGHLHKQ